MFHTHKIEWFKLLHSKLVFSFADGYLVLATKDTLAKAEYVPRFCQKSGHQYL